jgi:hypothetical protein
VVARKFKFNFEILITYLCSESHFPIKNIKFDISNSFISLLIIEIGQEILNIMFFRLRKIYVDIGILTAIFVFE